ncbi:hypothetical protein Cob_v011404 [Colletotrichum orbiculare MAFF 240422]|uniref:Uncharacterized protein n=1 Tax=Colletotrichum orbiculare (strain 104-T / ATCC 96160 / CBS 514.97 / LARS 414 / MAFF 240422) TaxID=1213857 RepID=N4V2X2_COLOR|nr:hypothetical protein Cob_v011404 [Colletotrichum orbiculare MAFF 240422]
MQSKILALALATLTFTSVDAGLLRKRASISGGYVVFPEVVFNTEDLGDPAFRAIEILRNDIQKTSALVGQLVRATDTKAADKADQANAIVRQVSANVNNIRARAGTIVTGLLLPAQRAANGVVGSAPGVASSVLGVIGGLPTVASSIVGAATPVASSVLGAVPSAASSIVGAATPAVSSVAGAVPSVASSVVGAVPSVASSVVGAGAGAGSGAAATASAAGPPVPSGDVGALAEDLVRTAQGFARNVTTQLDQLRTQVGQISTTADFLGRTTLQAALINAQLGLGTALSTVGFATNTVLNTAVQNVGTVTGVTTAVVDRVRNAQLKVNPVLVIGAQPDITF